jgi:hypothetical protein
MYLHRLFKKMDLRIVRSRDLNNNDEVEVLSMESQSPARLAGLRAGDWISPSDDRLKSISFAAKAAGSL